MLPSNISFTDCRVGKKLLSDLAPPISAGCKIEIWIIQTPSYCCLLTHVLNRN